MRRARGRRCRIFLSRAVGSVGHARLARARRRGRIVARALSEGRAGTLGLPWRPAWARVAAAALVVVGAVLGAELGSLSPAVEEVITVTSESPLLDERKVARGTTVSQIGVSMMPGWTELTRTFHRFCAHSRATPLVSSRTPPLVAL